MNGLSLKEGGLAGDWHQPILLFEFPGWPKPRR